MFSNPYMMIAAAVLATVSSARAESPQRLAAGWRHSVVVDEQGHVWTWGENRLGQLGDGSFIASPLPVAVRGPGGEGRLAEVVAVAAGTHHTLAILRDGTVWALGYTP